MGLQQMTRMKGRSQTNTSHRTLYHSFMSEEERGEIFKSLKFFNQISKTKMTFLTEV